MNAPYLFINNKPGKISCKNIDEKFSTLNNVANGMHECGTSLNKVFSDNISQLANHIGAEKNNALFIALKDGRANLAKLFIEVIYTSQKDKFNDYIAHRNSQRESILDIMLDESQECGERNYRDFLDFLIGFLKQSKGTNEIQKLYSELTTEKLCNAIEGDNGLISIRCIELLSLTNKSFTRAFTKKHLPKILEARNTDGQNILHMCAAYGARDALNFLLTSYCDHIAYEWHAMKEENRTSLGKHIKSSIQKLLEEEDDFQNTPKDIAKYHGNIKTLVFLQKSCTSQNENPTREKQRTIGMGNKYLNFLMLLVWKIFYFMKETFLGNHIDNKIQEIYKEPGIRNHKQKTHMNSKHVQKKIASDESLSSQSLESPDDLKASP